MTAGPPAIETRAVNCIPMDALGRWLADHGLDVADVREAVIRVDRRERDRVSAFLDVTYFLRDVDGNRFLGETGENAAEATASIPLRSWPPLQPAPPAA